MHLYRQDDVCQVGVSYLGYRRFYEDPRFITFTPFLRFRAFQPTYENYLRYILSIGLDQRT